PVDDSRRGRLQPARRRRVGWSLCPGTPWNPRVGAPPDDTLRARSRAGPGRGRGIGVDASMRWVRRHRPRCTRLGNDEATSGDWSCGSSGFGRDRYPHAHQDRGRTDRSYRACTPVAEITRIGYTEDRTPLRVMISVAPGDRNVLVYKLEAS